MARTPNARATADGVDPLTPKPNDPASQDGSTPEPQTTENVNADTATSPSESDLEAARGDDNEQTSDPLLNGDDLPGTPPGTDPSIDDEVEVKTKGAFMLMDPFTGKHFSNDEATKTPRTTFVSEKLTSGDLVEA